MNIVPRQNSAVSSLRRKAKLVSSFSVSACKFHLHTIGIKSHENSKGRLSTNFSQPLLFEIAKGQHNHKTRDHTSSCHQRAVKRRKGNQQTLRLCGNSFIMPKIHARINETSKISNDSGIL